MPETTVEELAARVAALEAQVAVLTATRLPPRLPLPPSKGPVNWDQLMAPGDDPPATPEEIESFDRVIREIRQRA
jgi:hypothetical protein